MAKNLIPEIAKMLGVEIGEKFKIKCAGESCVARGVHGKFFFKKDGLYMNDDSDVTKNEFLPFIFRGDFEIVKLPWKPKFNEKYYTFCRVFRYQEFDGWSIATYNWANTPMDVALLKASWVFRTREEAEEALPKVAEELGVEYEL